MKPKFTFTKVHWYNLLLCAAFFISSSNFSNLYSQCPDVGILETIPLSDQSGVATTFSTSYQEVCDAHYESTDSMTVEGPDWMFDITIPPNKRTACEATITVCRRGDFGGSGANPLNEPVVVFINGITVDTIWNSPVGTVDDDCDPNPICNTSVFNAAQINQFAGGGNIMVELRTFGGTCGLQPKETDGVCSSLNPNSDTYGDYDGDGILDGNCVQLQSFSWDVAPDITIACPGNDGVPACTSDDDIQIAFTSWLEGFSSSGGCDPLTVSPPPTAPLSCVGGTVTYNYVVADNAGRKDSCQATFTVGTPTPLSINCPDHENAIPSCTSQEDVDFMYDIWKQAFNFSDGCPPYTVNGVIPDNAPDVTVGGTIEVTYQVMDACTTLVCSSSFVVPDYVDLMVSCPAEQEFLACADQNTVDIAFLNWVAAFDATGGCEPYDEPSLPSEPPSVCVGDTIDITYTVTDALGVTKTCTSSFKVEGPPPLVVNGPQADVNLPACTPQAIVDAQFSTWLAQFTFSGGCSPYNETSKQIPTPQLCTGDTVVLNYMVTDACNNMQSALSTFRLARPATVDVTGPLDTVAQACDFLDQAAVDQAFANWKNQFRDVEIGCGPPGGFVEDLGPPSRCTGGIVTLEWTANDGCTSDNVAATFTLNGSTQVAVSCPANKTVSSCDFGDQAALTTDYNAWKQMFMITEAGCNGQGSFLNDFPAPTLCSDVVTVLIYQIDDGCTMASCTASYTLTVPNPVSVTCPAPVNQSGCAFTDQAALDQAYADWKALFVVTDPGCGATGDFADDPGPPNLATGGSVTLRYGAADICSVDTCEQTFMVTPGAPVDISCPNPESYTSCDFASQAALQTAFDDWVDLFIVNSSGCNATVGFTTTPVAPDRCLGGTVELIFTADDGFTMQQCSSTFTVTPMPVAVSCPANVSIASCEATDQAELNGMFNFWKSQFFVSDPGCGVTPPDLSGFTAPDICAGGTVTINYSITDGCTTASCTRSFVVAPTAPLEASCPGDMVETTCDDPEAAFREWLEGFMVTGGCVNVAEEFVVDMGGGPVTYTSKEDIPPIAGCNTVTVVYTVTGEGGCDAGSSSCSASFTVEPNPIDATCPAPINLESCLNDYEAAFLEWAEGFSISGGCGALTTVYTIGVDGSSYKVSSIQQAVQYIPVCGGTMDISVHVEDAFACESAGCSTSFSIESEEAVFLRCAPSEIVLPCEEFLPRYRHWIDAFEWGGGCNLEVICCIRYDDGPITIVTSFDDIPAPNQCGEKLNITIKITSACQGFFTCESTFEIKKSEPLTVSCPANMSVPACLSDEAMEQAYQDWLNSFSASGGCEVTTKFVGGIPTIPHYCGGSVEAVFLASDGMGCNPDAMCAATFTVEEVSELIVSCPADFMIQECVTQEEVDAAYNSWLEQFSYEGSCAAAGDFLGGIPAAPPSCGGTVEVTYKIPNTRSCFVFQTCTRSFTVTGGEGEAQIIGVISDQDLDCNADYPEVSDISGIDACGNTLSLILSEEISLNDSTCIETLVRSWTAEGMCDGSLFAEQTLTRKVDDQAPEIPFELESEITVDCGEIPDPEVFIPTDNCGIASFGVREDTVVSGAFSCPVLFQIVRTYFAVDECGTESTLEQVINVVSEEGPTFINPPADLCDPLVSMLEFMNMEFGPLEIMNPCTGEIGFSGDPILDFDCTTLIYTITWVAEDACGNSNSYTQTICLEQMPLTCDIVKVDEIPCGGISKYTLHIAGALPPRSIQWEVLSPSWSIVDGAERVEVFLQTAASDAEVKVTIIDANGCEIVCTALLSCELNGACTYTEAFYGNEGGETCEGASAPDVLAELLSEEPITIGMPGGSFTIQSGDAGCIAELLGQAGDGTSASIEGNGNCSELNVSVTDGASNNPLFNQLLALALNMEFDQQLFYWRIQDKCVRTLEADNCMVGPLDEGVEGTLDSFCFSQVVLDKLGAGFQVADLKVLADSAIAGFDVGLELKEITRALQFVNEAFAGCRIVDEFGDFADISASVTMKDEKSMIGMHKKSMMGNDQSILGMTIAPNPVTTSLNIGLMSNKDESGFLVIRDQNGKDQIKQTVSLQKGENRFALPTDELGVGMYIIQYVNADRYIIKKFMKIN